MHASVISETTRLCRLRRTSQGGGGESGGGGGEGGLVRGTGGLAALKKGNRAQALPNGGTSTLAAAVKKEDEAKAALAAKEEVVKTAIAAKAAVAAKAYGQDRGGGGGQAEAAAKEAAVAKVVAEEPPANLCVALTKCFKQDAAARGPLAVCGCPRACVGEISTAGDEHTRSANMSVCVCRAWERESRRDGSVYSALAMCYRGDTQQNGSHPRFLTLPGDRASTQKPQLGDFDALIDRSSSPRRRP